MQPKYKQILVVINLFSSAKNFVGDQFRFLVDNGYMLHLICSPHEDLESFGLSQGIKTKAVNLNRQLTLGQDFKSLLEICRYIKNNKIEVVIGHQIKARLLATIASFLTGVPKTIIFSHGAVYETMYGIRKKFLIAESRLESILSDKVVCVSDYIKELRLKDKIDKPSKQVILGAGTCGGIDTKIRFNPDTIKPQILQNLKNKYQIESNDFVVGFVGRLVKDKGVEELLDAFEMLKLNYPDKPLKLLIVGNPEKRDSLSEETLSIIQNSTDIIFTGQVDIDEMKYQYACMDCLVLPSHREGFGMCNIEAQAMKVPVLTTKITGCRDSIVENKTGLYIDLDAKDISNKISTLFDETYRQELALQGHKWVTESFDHSIIWPHVKSLLDSL